MTTRRTFIAGLMATAVAPPLLAKAAPRLFCGWDLASPLADSTAWFLATPPGPHTMVNISDRIYAFTNKGLYQWSALEDHNDWSPA